MNIGEKIKQIRESKGLTQRGLAIKCKKVTNATISRIESGDVSPSLDTLEDIALSLKINLNELLDNTQIKSEYLETTPQKNNSVVIMGRNTGKKTIEISEEDMELAMSFLEKLSKKD